MSNCTKGWNLDGASTNPGPMQLRCAVRRRNLVKIELYHGGFKVLKEDAGNVEIVWDGSERREILSQEECKDLKLGFQKVSKNHCRME